MMVIIKLPYLPLVTVAPNAYCWLTNHQAKKSKKSSSTCSSWWFQPIWKILVAPVRRCCMILRASLHLTLLDPNSQKDHMICIYIFIHVKTCGNLCKLCNPTTTLQAHLEIWRVILIPNHPQPNHHKKKKLVSSFNLSEKNMLVKLV